MDKVIYLENRNVKDYPKENILFHPSINYPEYPFGEECISRKQNEIYDMVRHTLLGLGLDEKNFNTPSWNPFGQFIQPGDRVVVKPNMVKHCDTLEQYECTLTHPSVVRVVIDYCIIAKAGKIIVGDAPIQGADIDKIKADYYYDDILEFYKIRNQAVEFKDFRNLIVKSKYGIIKTLKESESREFVPIDLGTTSKHYDENLTTKYEICGYVDQTINENHKNKKHQYVISKSILEADVIINLPKPKTHRFAGITGAQKNFVGTSSDKESLPHFKSGTLKVGGDETNQNNMHSRFIARIYRKYLWKCKEKHYFSARVYCLMYILAVKCKDEKMYTHGAWYGNDTIWRTIIDLNKIIFYADKNGKLDFSKVQRKVFTIGDMIIAGEKEGPLQPTPKELGCIMASTSCPVFDLVFCRMTGFDEKLIPTVANSLKEPMLSMLNWKQIELLSNEEKLNHIKLENLAFTKEFHFEPHPFWKEIL